MAKTTVINMSLKTRTATRTVDTVAAVLVTIKEQKYVRF